MDEKKIQKQRRDHEENSTQQRASILGMQYIDTREFEDELELIKEGMLTIEEMHKNRMVPLQKGDEYKPFRFGATSQTPQSVIQKLRQKYQDEGREAQIFLISNGGYNVLMLRYDPPKKVIYDDITIAKDGDSTTIASVSKTLNSVGSDQMLDYLIDRRIACRQVTSISKTNARIFVFVCVSTVHCTLSLISRRTNIAS